MKTPALLAVSLLALAANPAVVQDPPSQEPNPRKERQERPGKPAKERPERPAKEGPAKEGTQEPDSGEKRAPGAGRGQGDGADPAPGERAKERAPLDDPAPLEAPAPMRDVDPALRGAVLLRMFDLDGDGNLTELEIEEAPITLRRLDTDKNGVLSAVECGLPPANGKPVAEEQPAGPRTVHFQDKNGDGVVTKDELSVPLAARFEEFDLNSDGSLDGREIGAAVSTLRSRREEAPPKGPAVRRKPIGDSPRKKDGEEGEERPVRKRDGAGRGNGSGEGGDDGGGDHRR